MGTYRCLGCREYHRRPEYRRLGLGSVCSAECLNAATHPAHPPERPPTPHPSSGDVPPLVRAAVYVRDRQRCRMCGATAGLDLHHINYRSEGVDHRETNLITLCRVHHDLVHTDKGRWQRICTTYIGEISLGRRRFLPDIDRQLNERNEPPTLSTPPAQEATDPSRSDPSPPTPPPDGNDPDHHRQTR